jgi:Zn-dependent protease with chaperone function
VDIDRFKQIVARLERESAAAPRLYQAKVALLALLGFGILVLLLATAGLGLLLVAGLVVVLVLKGGGLLLVLAKLGKLLVLLVVPLWYLLKASVQALFIRLPAPQGREIRRAEAPALFEAIDGMRARMRGPRFHHVLVVDEVNAAIVQRPAFGVVGPPRNYLLLGLPLLESMPPQEALAVVAHEYGHLAGAHGHFGAFIYRLRITWGTLQAFAEQVQGWLGRLVVPLVRWYVPYFNAYSFVLARANEYQADAASAELVGAEHAAHALKRVNVVGPRHQRFIEQTFARIDHDPSPPADRGQRWAAQAVQPPEEADARRWLADALDRAGQPTDTHPTLRARLAALPRAPQQSAAAGAGDATAALETPPPPMQGDSAARSWLGPMVESLRAELDAQWAGQVAEPWSERHAQTRQLRERLVALRAMATPDADAQIETLRLVRRLEPDTDLRGALAAFNAAHADHPLGLFLEASVRLEKGEEEGLPLLERSMVLDAEATKAACEQAHGFLLERQRTAEAEAYAERWRRRDALEAARDAELRSLDAKKPLLPHGMDAATLAAVQALLTREARACVAEVYLARRVLQSDPTVQQFVVALRLDWWGRQRNRQQQVISRLTALEWPVPVLFFTLDGQYASLRKRLRALDGARIA